MLAELQEKKIRPPGCPVPPGGPAGPVGQSNVDSERRAEGLGKLEMTVDYRCSVCEVNVEIGTTCGYICGSSLPCAHVHFNHHVVP